LSLSYVGDGWASWNGYYDAESKTLTMYDYVTQYAVSNGYDEKGQIITLSDLETEAPVSIIRPNLNGLLAFDAAGVAAGSYALNDFYTAWYGVSYANGGVSVSVSSTYDENWNEVYVFLIDGEEVEASFVVIDGKTAVKATLSGVETVFTIDKAAISLRAARGEEVAYYLNESAYLEVYQGSFYAVDAGVISAITVSDSFGVSIDGVDYGGSLSYEEGDSEPSIVFFMGGKTQEFYLKDSSVSYYALLTEEGEKAYFGEDIYRPLNDVFTSTGLNRLTIQDGKLGFGESASIAYTLEPYTEDDGLNHLLSLVYQGTDGAERLVTSNGLDIYTTSADKASGSLNAVASYISVEGFESLIGEYRAYGRFGTETIKIEAGHFYSDTVNGDNTGLISLKEYDFALQASSNDDGPVYGLSFLANGVLVPAQLKDGSLVIGTETYYPSYIYDLGLVSNGVGAVYQSDSNVIYIENGSIYYNGETVSISGDVTSLSVEIAGETVAVTLDGDDLTLAFPDGSRTFVKKDFDISSYLGDYTVTVNGAQATYPFEITKSYGGLYTGYAVEVQEGVYYKASVILRNDILTIHASVVGVDIYIYNDGEKNVMEYVSSIPLPPSI